MSDRDTHFYNFARLVWEEMLSQTQWQGIDVTAGHIPLHHPEDEEHKIYIDIMAQRAYDLVMHSQQFMPGIENVPDIHSWDDVSEM